MVGREKVNRKLNPCPMSDWGSKTIIASGFYEDLAGQGITNSDANHQRFLLKKTYHPQHIISSFRFALSSYNFPSKLFSTVTGISLGSGNIGH
mgnify:CR=1 FL=1